MDKDILLSQPQLNEAKIKDLIQLDPSKDLLRQLVQIFNSEMQNAFTSMQQNYESNNFDAISKLAHRLRSTSLNLGVERLGEVFRQLEYFDFSSQNLKTFQNLLSSGEKERLNASEQLAHLII